MQTKLEEKLGRFAGLAKNFSLTNIDGSPATEVAAGKTVVSGSFRLVTKTQIARIIGIVTPGMTNTKNNDGQPVYRFKGNGWYPEAPVGHIILQDVNNPADIWACEPGLFGGTGWNGTVANDENGISVTYSKDRKPIIAVEIPVGTVVRSLEGPRTINKEGCLLVMTDANKGDFYIYTPDVVEKYIHNYDE
jgi:hypothetical protein